MPSRCLEYSRPSLRSKAERTSLSLDDSEFEFSYLAPQTWFWTILVDRGVPRKFHDVARVG